MCEYLKIGLKMSSIQIDRLREKFELLLKNKVEANLDDIYDTIDRLAEELSIHQFELEMQNQELMNINHQLLDEKEKFKELYMNAPVAYFTLNHTGNILQLNHAAADLLGVKLTSVYRTSLFPFLANDSKVKFTKYFKSIIDSEKFERIEVAFVNTKGRIIETQLSGKSSIDEHSGDLIYKIVVADISEQKKSEIELQNRNKLINHINEQMFDLVSLADTNLNYVFLSKSHKVLGYKEDEMMGKNAFEFIHPLDKEMAQIAFSSALNDGQDNGSVELRCLCADGSYIWLETIGKVLRNDDGNIENFLFSSRDITSKKDANDALMEAHNRMLAVMNHMNSMVYIVGKSNDELLFANERTLQIFGSNIIGLACWEVFGFEGNKKCSYCTRYSSHSDCKIEKVFEIKNQSNNQWYEVRYTHINWIDGRDATLFELNDITERNKAQLAIKDSEAKMGAILNSSLESIWSVNRDYEIQFINEVFQNSIFNVYGIKLEKGDNIIYKMPESILEFWKRKYDKALTNEHFVFIEEIDISIGKVYVEVSMYPIVVNDEVVGVACYGKDITSRIVAEQKLIESESKLKMMNYDKDKFFSIIAHDLKGPLGTFRSIANMMQESADDVPLQEQNELLGLMKSTSDNLYELLDDLLYWSRAQLGVMPFEIEKIDVAIITQIIVATLEPIARSKKIKLVNYIDKPMFVNADANMISTVIRNLITNAIKFTPKDGFIELSAEYEDEYLTVTIKDTGIGIGDELLEKLFRVGADIGSTKGTSGEQGTGMGLILCKEFVDRHNGMIGVQSKKGNGSKFYFKLPYKPKD